MFSSSGVALPGQVLRELQQRWERKSFALTKKKKLACRSSALKGLAPTCFRIFLSKSQNIS
jgi:hypothetical protein